MTDKTLFCILGRTASGKDTLAREICKIYGLKQVISYTTRPKRFPSEDTHIFATELDYHKDCIHNNIAAQTIVNGYTYWATKEQIYANDIYIVDPNGLQCLKESMPNVRIVAIYIYIQDEDRRKRFLLREPHKPDLYEQRNASEAPQFDEFEQNHVADYLICNDRFDSAIYCLDRIVDFERNR